MAEAGNRGVVLLCAGGTGGHLFPAEALAHALAQRGWRIHLATDDRAAKYSATFPAEAVHFIASATVFGRNPLALGKAAFLLARGYLQSRRLLRSLQPKAAVGFGGYPTLPPMLAACHLDVPTLIHDANAVMGRANRLLASRVNRIALGFGGADAGAGANAGTGARAVVTGNPVRPQVLAAARVAYPDRRPSDPFCLLVFGGSQGARFFSRCVPDAVAMMDEKLRRRLRIVQQARPEDLDKVDARYRQLGVAAEIEPFFDNLPQRIARSHLVIARGGAGTVSELAVIGRPAILVPLPHAIDQDQARNAAALADCGAAQAIAQAQLSPERLADLLAGAITDPARLTLAAGNASRLGRPDAASALADSVEAMVGENARRKEMPA